MWVTYLNKSGERLLLISRGISERFLPDATFLYFISPSPWFLHFIDYRALKKSRSHLATLTISFMNRLGVGSCRWGDVTLGCQRSTERASSSSLSAAISEEKPITINIRNHEQTSNGKLAIHTGNLPHLGVSWVKVSGFLLTLEIMRHAKWTSITHYAIMQYFIKWSKRALMGFTNIEWYL